MPFDSSSLATLLRCPRSHRPLVQEGDALISTDPGTRLRFAILDGIPDMLLEEATELSIAEWSQVMQRNGRDATTGEIATGETGA